MLACLACYLGCSVVGELLGMRVAGGFWAVILTRPAHVRHWALVWPRSKHVVADKVVPKQPVWVGTSM